MKENFYSIDFMLDSEDVAAIALLGSELINFAAEIRQS
jgi:hypothetical protein